MFGYYIVFETGDGRCFELGDASKDELKKLVILNVYLYSFCCILCVFSWGRETNSS